jgi:hypothetical protein
MSKQEESINKAGTISRFITCTQSTGRVGKSTVAEGLITWMRYAGIDFAAVDADSQHQSLSRRYPEDSAIFDATKTFDGFAAMRGAAESINSISGRWMLVVIIGAYLMGMVSYPVFAGLITWLEKVL